MMPIKSAIARELTSLSIELNNELRYRFNNRELSEALIALIEVDKKIQLDPVNQAALRLLVNWGEGKLRSNLYFYAAFYNLPQRVYEKDAEGLSKNIEWANTQIAGFRAKMHLSNVLGFSLDSSEDEYFFSRFERIIRALRNYIKHPFEFDLNAWVYLVLNYYQALHEYIAIIDNTHEKACIENMASCENVFRYIFEKWDLAKEAILKSRQLRAFWNSTVPVEWRLKCNELDYYAGKRAFCDTDRWVLISEYKTNPDQAHGTFMKCCCGVISEKILNVKKHALNVRLLTHALEYLNDTSLINEDVLIYHLHENSPSKYDISHFFRFYNDIRLNQCTQDELTLLQNYDDETLRKKVASCLINVNMTYVATQMSKPHTGYEISDMDIEYLEDREIRYLCMPVKSGKEITRSTVSEQIAYQIYKPFSYFGADCIVVFVTAKPIGAALDSYIKRMALRARGWRVYVLQEHQLGYLLKLNGQLN